MTPEQHERFRNLQDPWCSYGLIRELHGIDLSNDQALAAALRSWGHRHHRQVFKPGDLTNRHVLETFFQVMRLLPKKIAAAKLGMAEASLKQVDEELKPQGFLLTSPLSEQLVEEPRLRDIVQFFPNLSHTIFDNHNEFCKSLHEAIRTVLGTEVTPLYCVTSQARHETPPQYASDFDAITLEPVGVQYQVWLDLKKPMHLKPDCCAVKTYAENQAILQHYLFAGEQPSIPSELSNLLVDQP